MSRRHQTRSQGQSGLVQGFDNPDRQQATLAQRAEYESEDGPANMQNPMYHSGFVANPKELMSEIDAKPIDELTPAQYQQRIKQLEEELAMEIAKTEDERFADKTGTCISGLLETMDTKAEELAKQSESSLPPTLLEKRQELIDGLGPLFRDGLQFETTLADGSKRMINISGYELQSKLLNVSRDKFPPGLRGDFQHMLDKMYVFISNLMRNAASSGIELTARNIRLLINSLMNALHARGLTRAATFLMYIMFYHFFTYLVKTLATSAVSACSIMGGSRRKTRRNRRKRNTKKQKRRKGKTQRKRKNKKQKKTRRRR